MRRIQITFHSWLVVLCALISMTAGQWGQAQSIGFNSDDTVTVKAERAWEAEESDVIHFSGNFELLAPDWSLRGDTAVVYGSLDDPDRVIVEGNPASISFLLDPDEDATTSEPREQVDGAASIVEYFRSTDKLKMRGAAKLTRKSSTISSEDIEYDIDADKYSASGEGGIDMQFIPDDL
jgi:lipopolysaccharide transport protein LptA